MIIGAEYSWKFSVCSLLMHVTKTRFLTRGRVVCLYSMVDGWNQRIKIMRVGLWKRGQTGARSCLFPDAGKSKGRLCGKRKWKQDKTAGLYVMHAWQSVSFSISILHYFYVVQSIHRAFETYEIRIVVGGFHLTRELQRSFFQQPFFFFRSSAHIYSGLPLELHSRKLSQRSTSTYRSLTSSSSSSSSSFAFALFPLLPLRARIPFLVFSCLSATFLPSVLTAIHYRLPTLFRLSSFAIYYIIRLHRSLCFSLTTLFLFLL